MRGSESSCESERESEPCLLGWDFFDSARESGPCCESEKESGASEACEAWSG